MYVNRKKDHSAAHAIRSRVLRGGSDRLWTYADFPDVGRMALAAALSRLVKAGELTRVRRGVYYRSKTTVFGPSKPDPEALVDAAFRARGEDALASGIGAYPRLGLTTQVSSTVTRATRRRVGRNFMSNTIPGLRVHTRLRPLAAQKGIRPVERVVLDALRDIGRIPDADAPDTLRRLRMLLRSGGLSYSRLARFAAVEPPRVRALLGALGEDLRSSPHETRIPDSAIRGLRASLNPLTGYAIPGVRSVLATARAWRVR